MRLVRALVLPVLGLFGLPSAIGCGQAPPGAMDAAAPDAGGDVGAADDAWFPPAIEPPASFDESFQSFLSDWQIPGMAVAVTYEGRLIFARGYGLADVTAGMRVHERSRFRVASLSKAVTAVAVLTLVEDGLIDLEAPAFSYLEHLPAPPGSTPDPRVDDILVRHLLQHSSGWTFDYPSGDPLTEVPDAIREVATAMGVPSPADHDTLVRYLRGHVPLGHDPGTTFGYANVNYVVLGRIIEAVTGRSYEDYVRDAVLAPMGIHAMEVGDTRAENRLEDEVVYYDAPGAELVGSVYDGVTEPVPWPYGGWDLRAMDAGAGWVADVVEYSRFLVSFDGDPGYPDVLTPASIAAMTELAPELHGVAPWAWYGFGVGVGGTPGNLVLAHDGGLQGTTTTFKSAQGYTFVLFFNSNPEYPPTSAGDPDYYQALSRLLDDTVRAIFGYADTVPGFHQQDLFARYP